MSKKKPGRKSLLEMGITTTPKVIAAYHVHGSIRPTARALGIGITSTKKILNDAGIDTSVNTNIFHPEKTNDFGCLASWIREHKTTELPVSVKKICELTGCSEDAVKSYLYRRRKRIKVLFEQVKPLFEIDKTVIDYSETIRSLKDILEYKIHRAKYTYKIYVDARLKDGTVIGFTLDDFRALLKS